MNKKSYRARKQNCRSLHCVIKCAQSWKKRAELADTLPKGSYECGKLIKENSGIMSQKFSSYFCEDWSDVSGEGQEGLSSFCYFSLFWKWIIGNENTSMCFYYSLNMTHLYTQNMPKAFAWQRLLLYTCWYTLSLCTQAMFQLENQVGRCEHIPGRASHQNSGWQPVQWESYSSHSKQNVMIFRKIEGTWI